MFRKLALAAALAAGAAFVAQPALFANDQKTKQEKPAKKDAIDNLIKKAKDASAEATKKGKTDLATAYDNLAAAYEKEKEAKNASPRDEKAVTAAKDAVEKATKDVELAKNSAAASKSSSTATPSATTKK